MFGIVDTVNGYWNDASGKTLEFVSKEQAEDYLVLNGVTNAEASGLFIQNIK
jgi:hypothetical protein